MPLTGTLRNWHDDRGFGFIAPTQGGAELFVHISAFPSDGTRPCVGEKLIYELGRSNDGKPQAVKVIRAAIGRPVTPLKPPPRHTRSTNNWFGSLLVLLLLLIGGAYGYKQYKAHQHRMALEQATAIPAPAAIGDGNPGSLRCDGRSKCSQMTSCTEAKWFLNHCPGMAMDGNHDGTPCEQQWCTSPFAK